MAAPFPIANGAVIQSYIEQAVTDTAIAFAIHVRRLLDKRDIRTRFTLNEPFWHWEPTGGASKVALLQDALIRIVHATDFEVGFERLPENTTRIAGGAICVLYLRTKTDQRDEALVDVFALASLFFPLGLTHPTASGKSQHGDRPLNQAPLKLPSNNSMQRRSLRAAADAERSMRSTYFGLPHRCA